MGLFVPRRVAEATPEQIVATGAAAGSYGHDPLDNDRGWRLAGSSGRREVPEWTREKARVHSVAAYRCNPMAAAIIDTMTAFCVGDSGVKPLCVNSAVAEVVDDFWSDPSNNIGGIQEVSLRSLLLLGEKLYELLVGDTSGVVRLAPVEPSLIKDITLRAGNPMWPATVVLPPMAGRDDDHVLDIVAVSDETGLRTGNGLYWAPWRTLDTDIRGMPFLTPVLDWLDSYDQVISNLMDRTVLSRYLVWDVTVTGSNQGAVDDYVTARGGLHIPPSGSVEIHNESVKWEPKTAPTGAAEDTQAAQAVLTNIAAGAGLSKPWLAEAEDANRATSLTMAEPVRRRVGGIQKQWLALQTELCRFAVDRAVAAKRLDPQVQVQDPRSGASRDVPAAMAVEVVGPEIAAADAQITAQVMLNLATGLEKLITIGAISKEGAQLAARKAWEAYVGVPYRADLDVGKTDAVAEEVAQAAEARRRLVSV